MPAAIKLHTRRIFSLLSLIGTAFFLFLLLCHFFSSLHPRWSSFSEGERERETEAAQVVAIDTQNDRAESGTIPEPLNSGHYQPSLDPVDYTLSHPLENHCHLPLLAPTEPDILPFTRHYRDIQCPPPALGPRQQPSNRVGKQSKEPGPSHWAPLVRQLRDGRMLFGRPHRVRLERGAHVECWAWELTGCLAPNNVIVEERERERIQLRQNQLETLPDWDQFVVKCFSWQSSMSGDEGRRALVYHNAFTNIAAKPKESFSPVTTPDGPYSINIVVIDSTARSQFLRHMPLSWEFLQREGFHTLHGLLKVGDNSAINLLPLMAGMVFQARKRGFTEEMLTQYQVSFL